MPRMSCTSRCSKYTNLKVCKKPIKKTNIQLEKLNKSGFVFAQFEHMKMKNHRSGKVTTYRIKRKDFLLSNTKECQIQLLMHTEDHSIENPYFTARRDGTPIARINYTTSVKIEK